jgi:hypothetical protein
MVNFYRRFTPGIAKVLEPLTTELKGGKKTLQWSPHLDAAFNKSKQVLKNAVPLAHPAPDAAIAVATDASDTHIGGVLNQQVEGSWQPLGFFSRKGTSINYLTFLLKKVRTQIRIETSGPENTSGSAMRNAHPSAPPCADPDFDSLHSNLEIEK